MRRYLFSGFLPALASQSAPLCAAEGTTGAAAPPVGAASGAAAELPQLVLGLGLVIGLLFLLASQVRRVQQAGPR
ncbi:flagellar assembly protein FliO, partial [Pseudomonas aeruginosa]